MTLTHLESKQEKMFQFNKSLLVFSQYGISVAKRFVSLTYVINSKHELRGVK